MKRIMMKMVVLSLFATIELNAQVKSRLCGMISDESGRPVYGAKINVYTDVLSFSAISDSTGSFCTDSISVGRVKVEILSQGFQTALFQEFEMKSGNASFLQTTLQEKVSNLKEVVVKGKESKDKPNNSMALVGARRLSMEEASRYAGGFDDPARLASSFGGASGGIGNNGIAVRGNKPGSFQWRMEGMEIPNPNHFADVISFGAGGLSALSAQLISSADFFTGGFPAEYGNALAGIMDIKIRNGINSKRRYGFKIGAIGTEAATEGPFKMGKKSTYNIHYRYSTLGLISFLLPPEAGGIRYQDLSMKLYFPTRAGKFSVWYLGALDKSGQVAVDDSTKWKYDYERESSDSRQGFSVAGASHKIPLTSVVSLNNTLTWSTNAINHDVNRLDNALREQDYQRIKSITGRYSVHTSLDIKSGPVHTNKTGAFVNEMYYDMNLRTKPDSIWYTIADQSGSVSLIQLYSQSKFNLSDRWTIAAGLHSSRFSLSKQQTLEPRVSAAFALSETSTLAAAYGNHSQMERIQVYSIQNDAGEKINRDLKLSRAHHAVLSWDIRLSEKMRMKTEVYHQELYDIPVVDSGSYSLINETGNWFFQQELVNKGKGRNTGADVTLERFMNKGFYYLITGSVFDSRYLGGDNVWRSTRYNRNWIANILIGKEWKTGKTKSNLFSANLRLTMQGGERITPVQYQNYSLVEDANAFSKTLPVQNILHSTITYRINKNKYSSLWSLQLINALSTPEIQGYVYNLQSEKVEYKKDVLFIPNVSYKIEF